MATITQLPNDVIFIILENEILTMQDIVNFKSTCKRFEQITLSNKFWERRYYQRCFIAEKNNSRKIQKKNFLYINFQQILYYIRKLQYYAIIMSKNMLYDTDKKQLESLLRSIVENSMTYYFVLDEINRIFAQKPCKLFSNLTREYNFKLIFYYLKQYRFIYKQMNFMNMPETKLILEKQLTIMAQCFQPRVSYAPINTWLNSITQTVLSRVKNEYPAHSICFTTSEQFSFWSDNYIDDNFWNETESRQIMCVLEKYIYSELESHELHELLMTLDFEAKYIKYIAENFLKFVLAVTYHIVARRLGIYSSLRTERRNIEVRWKPKYNPNNRNDAERFYVNPYFNPLFSLNILSNSIMDFQINAHLQMLIEPLQCIQLTREIMNYFYDKFKYDHKIQFNWNFKLFNFLWQYFTTNIKRVNIEIEYKKITSTIEVKPNTVKKSLNKRTKNVKFAVGMIVTHLHDPDSDDHDGVIIGWHCECNQVFLCKLYNDKIFPYLRQCSETDYVCTNPRFDYSTHEQLHYIILTENNNICYVQQNKLLICHPKQINNIKIGKYFSSFEGTHYVPNKNLRKYYPEDTAAIAEILAKQ